MPDKGRDKLKTIAMWNRLQAVADEQAGTLMQTAFSPIVRESGDLSAGVFDLQGRMLTQAVTGTPGHVNTMAAAVANFFDHFPRQSMRPGDLFVSNDPWLGSGHLNDFVLVKPCFHGDRLVGFVSCTSHLVDIGGQCMGPDGTDVYDEGLYIPPIALLDEGTLNQTLLTLIKANSRIPQESEGDVHALIACCEVGEKRLAGMLRDFETSNLDVLSEAILQASESATRARIAELPDGTYRNHLTTDGYDFEIELEAALTVDGDSLTLDFEGSSAQSRHGINVPLNYAKAYSVFGIKCVVAPDIPNNAGALAPMEVRAPLGSIVNARKPAPVCSRHIVGQLLPDAVFGCLSQILPERVPAEGASTLWDLPLRIPADDQSYSIELVHNGGTGARPCKDGLSATGFPSGVMGSLVEITENVAPILVRRRELRPDSAGAGRYRGGFGQIIEIESRTGSSMQLFGTLERINHPAWGRNRGKPGACGVLQLASGKTLGGKGSHWLPGGDPLEVMTPGGGGYGEPLERDPAQVAADVASGLVSRVAAENDYGVILDADGRLDLAATESKRGALAAAPDELPDAVRRLASLQRVRASRGRARLGVVVPISNTNMEPDLMMLCPEGVSLHFTRAGGYDLDAIPDSEQMRAFALSSLDETVAQLQAALADIVVYGCTSATLSHGPAFDRSFREQIEARAGVPAVTAAEALVAALSSLNVTRVGFCSPYVRKLNEEAVAFLEACGFSVVATAEVEEDLGNYGQGAMTPEDVYELGLRADHPRAEAVVLSCTDLRAVEAIDALEETLAKPVVSSNQALMYAALTRLGIALPEVSAGGLLFRNGTL